MANSTVLVTEDFSVTPAKRPSMHESTGLQLIRMRAAAQANGQDASLWRWFADQMEDRRLSCERFCEYWSIRLGGRELACDRSFDVAVRSAYTRSHGLEDL
jgi:hypothetical protein